MGLLYDHSDPTTALFLTPAAAERAAKEVRRQHSHKIARTEATRRVRRGETLGYALNIHFRDGRPASPLTNSDFERLTCMGGVQ